MTKSEIKSFTESLIDGLTLDGDVFDAFLDVAQRGVESERPWVILRSVDTSQQALTSDTYLTQKNLPTGFKRFYGRSPIKLTDSQGNVVRYLREIDISNRNQYKDDPSKFYVDYRTKKLYICGAQAVTTTINIFYIVKPELVSADDGNEWDFDSWDESYSKLLGFDVAVMYKLGVDYDQINAQQGNNNAMAANKILNSMFEWDDALQRSQTEGMDYEQHGNRYQGENSGFLGNLIP